eukprot:351883-Chlamydomonas_euryale.AAC.3
MALENCSRLFNSGHEIVAFGGTDACHYGQVATLHRQQHARNNRATIARVGQVHPEQRRGLRVMRTIQQGILCNSKDLDNTRKTPRKARHAVACPLRTACATSPRSPCLRYSSRSRARGTPDASATATATVEPPTLVSPPTSCSAVTRPVMLHKHSCKHAKQLINNQHQSSCMDACMHVFIHTCMQSS